MSKTLNLDGFNEMPEYSNRLHYGFFIIDLAFNGKAKVYDAKGVSFGGNYQGSGPSSHASIEIALEKVREWSVYIWNHNDRKSLVKEYGLTRGFVNDFLGYTFPE